MGRISAQCHKNCNQNGECDFWGRCHCFEGYEGVECNERSCPKGRAFADVAHGNDAAHREVPCSGRGDCIKSSGQCACHSGFYGDNCGKTYCPNNCNGNGRCLSLRDSAVQYDGYALNYSTSYNLWDADLIHGCICDSGWQGHDCSQQVCEVGVDPRVSTSGNEVISLVCECSGAIVATCMGKFKLSFLGNPLNSWFHPINEVKGTVTNGGSTLTVTDVYYGKLAVGQTVSGTGIPAGTTISAQKTITGLTRTAMVKATTTAGSTTLTVTEVNTGAVAVGNILTGNGIPTDTIISALGSGSGGTGTYTLSASATATGSNVVIQTFNYGKGSSSGGGLTGTYEMSNSATASGAGITIKSYTIASEISTAIMGSVTQFFGPSSSIFVTALAQSSSTVAATGASSSALASASICAASDTTTTTITFQRQANDMPSIAFYSNRVTAGSLYFLTTQSLVCDCTTSCSGYFRIAFDGEMGPKQLYTDTATNLVTNLNNLRVMKAAKATVSSPQTSAICVDGASTTTTVYIKAPAGNMPRPDLWSSVHSSGGGSAVSSSSSKMSWSYSDGRDSAVKECNGIGKCVYASKKCTCPFGWESDATYGPCGKITTNTSDFLGIGRCPGLVRYDNLAVIDNIPNYHDKAYIVFNPDAASKMIASWTSTTLTVHTTSHGYLRVGDFIFGDGITGKLHLS